MIFFLTKRSSNLVIIETIAHFKNILYAKRARESLKGDNI